MAGEQMTRFGQVRVEAYYFLGAWVWEMTIADPKQVGRRRVLGQFSRPGDAHWAAEAYRRWRREHPDQLRKLGLLPPA